MDELEELVHFFRRLHVKLATDEEDMLDLYLGELCESGEEVAAQLRRLPLLQHAANAVLAESAHADYQNG